MRAPLPELPEEYSTSCAGILHAKPMEDRVTDPIMSNDLPTLVIEGVTLDGMVFRPSDWIERLIGTLSAYGEDRRASTRVYAGMDRRQRQESFLRAQMIDGSKCLVVDIKLREVNPAAYHFLLEFIQSNRLRNQATDRNPALGVLPSSGSV